MPLFYRYSFIYLICFNCIGLVGQICGQIMPLLRQAMHLADYTMRKTLGHKVIADVSLKN